jgi:Fe(3+) dicitrate transport protein
MSLNSVKSLLRVFLSLVAASCASPAAAQSAPSLSGRVFDATGAVLPGATVCVSRPGVSDTLTIVTDDAGRYRVANLASGTYVVVASLEGFASSRAEASLADQPVTLDVVLGPARLSDEVTVIGSRLVESEDRLRRIPGSFDALSRETLTASHVFTTSEALRKLPGVTVRDEEGLGLRPNIGIRGLNPTRSGKLLLLEDGLPIAFAPYGDNATYYHPPIERFARVEVLKGSSQIAHGPVTLGGVVNYITPDAPARTSATLGITGGNRGYLNLGGSFGGTWTGTGVFAQAVRKQSRGARDNVSTGLTDGLLKATRALGPTQHLAIRATYYGEDSQVTYSGLRDAEYAAAPRQNPFANDAFNGWRAGASATYTALVASRTAFTGQAYASWFARDWWRQSSNSNQRPNDASDPACGGMANLNVSCGNEGRLRRYRHAGVEVRSRVPFTAGLAQETDLGARIHAEYQGRRQENGTAPLARSGVLVEDDERTADAVAAFAQHRVLAGRWTVTPGVRIERVSYTRTNRLAGASGRTAVTEVIPGLGVSYAVAEQATVFAGAHRGFAPPRVEDVINNASGGAVDLDPERSWNYEIGGRAGVGRAIRVDAAWFRLDYENQIVPASLAGGVGAALTNGGATRHQGIEAGVNGDWQSIRSGNHGLYTRLALTWLQTASFASVRTSSVPGFSGVSVSGNRLPYAPELSGAFTAGYRHRSGLDAQVEAQHVGDQFGDDLNTRPGTPDGQRGLIPAYTCWNLAVSWHVPRSGGSIYVAVKNLADRTFIVDRSRGILPGHPRLVQVGTTWRF